MQFDQIVALLEVYKYVIMFPLVVVEGVITTIIAGFLASTGFMNIYLVIVVAVVADLVSDAVHYSLGRFGREKLLKRWGHLVGVTDEKVVLFEKRFSKHAGKVLFVGKFLPGIDVLSIVSAGVIHVPFKTFLFFVILPSVPKFTLYAFLGYFFGSAYIKIAGLIDNFENAFMLIILVLVLIGLSYRIFVGRLAKSLFGLK